MHLLKLMACAAAAEAVAHATLVPVKLGEGIRVRLGHESMVVEMFFTPEKGLARDAAYRYYSSTNS